MTDLTKNEAIIAALESAGYQDITLVALQGLMGGQILPAI